MTFDECSAMNVSRMTAAIWSTVPACVQYESWTDANVRPWDCKWTVSDL